MMSGGISKGVQSSAGSIGFGFYSY